MIRGAHNEMPTGFQNMMSKLGQMRRDNQVLNDFSGDDDVEVSLTEFGGIIIDSDPGETCRRHSLFGKADAILTRITASNGKTGCYESSAQCAVATAEIENPRSTKCFAHFDDGSCQVSVRVIRFGRTVLMAREILLFDVHSGIAPNVK